MDVAHCAKAQQAEMKIIQERSLRYSKILKESEVEKTLERGIYGVLAKHPLRLRRSKIVWGHIWPNDAMDKFLDSIDNANDAGRISDDQHNCIIRSDFIASARRRESDEYVHVAVEASSKIGRNDVDWAMRSRDALQAAFEDSDALAAVFGWEISDDDRRYAESNGVAVYISAPKR